MGSMYIKMMGFAFQNCKKKFSLMHLVRNIPQKLPKKGLIWNRAHFWQFFKDISVQIHQRAKFLTVLESACKARHFDIHKAHIWRTLILPFYKGGLKFSTNLWGVLISTKQKNLFWFIICILWSNFSVRAIKIQQ